MAISFVNGLLCTCSCDVAKAKLGQDPHPAEHAARLRSERAAQSEHAPAGAKADAPSVVFGGSLGDLGAGKGVPRVDPDNAMHATPAAVPGSVLDLFA